MPRPRHQRLVRFKPTINLYKPQGVPARDIEWRTLPHEGLEAMRLVDAMGLSQADAAQSMGVSAPTLCRVLAQARSQVALALTHGQAIRIEGGDYRLIDDEPPSPAGPGRGRGRRRQGRRRGGRFN